MTPERICNVRDDTVTGTSAVSSVASVFSQMKIRGLACVVIAKETFYA